MKYKTFEEIETQITKRKLIYKILETRPDLSPDEQFDVFRVLDKLSLSDLVAALESHLPKRIE